MSNISNPIAVAKGNGPLPGFWKTWQHPLQRIFNAYVLGIESANRETGNGRPRRTRKTASPGHRHGAVLRHVLNGGSRAGRLNAALLPGLPQGLPRQDGKRAPEVDHLPSQVDFRDPP
ncbi:MAG: hypothetical protein OXD45_00820 [Rhodobacteraceae bacterium]|nr:hypothetical protein [Paracoccaceae bacterium]